jgi:hypothetical protein
MLRTIDNLTTEWLTEAVGVHVSDFTVTQVGTGQMSDSYRVELHGCTPPSVVVKLAAADETSRATGAALGLYRREVAFYDEIGPLIGGPVARTYLAEFNEDDHAFTLVIGDAAPARQGDEITGATRAEAEAAIAALAAIHGPSLGDERLARSDWLNRDSPITGVLMTALLTGFLERYGERIATEHQIVCRRLVASFDGWLALADTVPRGLVHGDYRLDNLLFGDDGSVTVVDWQTVAYGDAFTDLAYFLGCALAADDRRAWADALVHAYHGALGPAAPTLQHVRDGIRRQAFFGVMMAIISPMMVVRTERGDDMFMAVLERHAEQVLDLDALALLPAPEVLAPRRAEREDEHAHPAGPERLFNESWYFDLVDPVRGVGAYVRLGTYPNLDRSWYTAVICGPGRPTVAIVDLHAPLPADDLSLGTAAFTATQAITAPLERARISLTGAGLAYDDPAMLLRGGNGRDVAVALDLTWVTEGTPYQYRLTPRYEIPCRVHGTMTVDGETLTIDGPGQRDHSWGVRDWWSMDWVWFAAHLDDGTRLHGLDLRIPSAPQIGIGYAQGPGTAIHELESVVADTTIGRDGLPTRARLKLQPGDLELEVTPLGHGPLLLADDDGRVAEFPRAWCRVETANGRSGVAWIECNHNLTG